MQVFITCTLVYRTIIGYGFLPHLFFHIFLGILIHRLILFCADVLHMSVCAELAQTRASRLDCVRAHEQCLGRYGCSSAFRTMRQCLAGTGGNFSALTEPEAQDECRNAMESMRQSFLYNCKCKRGMKKEKKCLRIFWSVYHSLQGL